MSNFAEVVPQLLVSLIGTKICRRLYTIAEASVLLIHESGKEMNVEFQKDLLEFFYEKVLDEQTLSTFGLEKETLTNQILQTLEDHRESLAQQAENIDDVTHEASMDVAPESSNGNNHTNNSSTQKNALGELWEEFFELCWLHQDGLKLEGRFNASAEGSDVKILNLSVKFEKIIALLKRGRDRIPPDILLELKQLEKQGFLPFSPDLKRSTSPAVSVTGKNKANGVIENPGPKKRGKPGRKPPSIRDQIPKNHDTKQDAIWWDYFDKLIQYHEDNGTYNVPISEVILDDEGESFELGQWLHEQRANMGEPHFMRFQTDKYDVLADLMCEGLWTATQDDSTQKKSDDSLNPNLFRPSSSSSSTGPINSIVPITNSTSSKNETLSLSQPPTSTPSKPNLSSQTSVATDLLSPVSTTSSNNSSGAGQRLISSKPVSQLSRKSSGASRARTVLIPAVPPAEPKSAFHLPKRQDKNADPRDSDRTVGSRGPQTAEPKPTLLVSAKVVAESDDEEEVAVVVNQRKVSEKPNPAEIDTCILYWRSTSPPRLSLGKLQEDSGLYRVTPYTIKSPSEGWNSQFVLSDEQDLLDMSQIELGNIKVLKGKQ